MQLWKNESFRDSVLGIFITNTTPTEALAGWSCFIPVVPALKYFSENSKIKRKTRFKNE